MSAAGRKRMAEATRKRWAAGRAAKAAPQNTAKPVAREKPASKMAVATEPPQGEQAATTTPTADDRQKGTGHLRFPNRHI